MSFFCLKDDKWYLKYSHKKLTYSSCYINYLPVLSSHLSTKIKNIPETVSVYTSNYLDEQNQIS